LLLALAAPSVAAFSSPSLAFKRAVVGTMLPTAATSTSLQATKLNDIDTMCIMNIAEYCSSEECSLDDREALLARVEEQRDILSAQVDDMNTIIDHIKGPQAN